MGLDELVPGNSQRARATAVKAFGRFLQAESVELDYVKGCILHDATGQCFVSTMDKFGMYLALHEGKAGKPLARHSCMQYYRQAKHWLLDLFPQHRGALESKLLKMGRTLESYCVKREGGGFVKKAAACTKGDLKRMIHYLYANGSAGSDYQDAALLALLWHMFGRASDLTHVHKQNVCIDAGGVLFVRFIRMKTCEEQGLSLFPDNNWAVCPILALALAFATQAAPSADLLDHLPAQRLGPISALVAEALAADTSLVELLDDPGSAAAISATAGTTTAIANAPTLHNHVNRLLDRISRPAGVDEELSSHSFRRGGAQHANGSAQLTDRWIFDRGAWNMSTTNKAFNYVFNTRAEDHKVAKALSDRRPDDTVKLLDLAAFDTSTRSKILAVQERPFATCHAMQVARYNVDRQVLDVCMAYLLVHFPHLKDASADGFAVRRIEACLTEAGFSVAEMLAWSTHLQASQCDLTTATRDHQIDTVERHTIRHQASVIDRLITLARRQDERLDALEEKLNSSSSVSKTKRGNEDGVSDEPAKRIKIRQQAQVTHLRTVWFEWFAREPRVWSSTDDKQKKSNWKYVVAFMKLFIADGFVLDADSDSYRDDVMRVGIAAETAMLAFLNRRKIASKGAVAVLKHMRTLHRDGELNDRITGYRRHRSAGAIVDPSPPHTHDILETTTFALPTQ